jgi:hypothetical protein
LIYLDYKKESDRKAIVYGSTTFKEYATEHFIEVEENDIPTPENKVGKIAILYCNPLDKNLWYEYEDRKLTIEEELLNKLDNTNATILNLMTEVANLKKGSV